MGTIGDLVMGVLLVIGALPVLHGLSLREQRKRKRVDPTPQSFFQLQVEADQRKRDTMRRMHEYAERESGGRSIE